MKQGKAANIAPKAAAVPVMKGLRFRANPKGIPAYNSKILAAKISVIPVKISISLPFS